MPKGFEDQSQGNLRNDSGEERRRPRGGATEPESKTPIAESTSSPAKGACLSNTHLQSSHPPLKDGLVPVTKSTVAIDWMSKAGLIQWLEKISHPYFESLKKAKEKAIELNESVPVNLAGYDLLVLPLGRGSGRDSHREIVLHYGTVEITLSERQGENRTLYNYSLQIPGTACLLIGYEQINKVVGEIIEFLGGKIIDEWIKRIDICLDLPDVNLVDWILKGFQDYSFTSTAGGWHPYDGPSGVTGFTIGRSKRLQFNVYDKLKEALEKSDPAYLVGMIQHRWHETIPEHAIRLEFQITKPWLDNLGLKTCDSVLTNLPNIVDRLINRTDGNTKPFIWFADSAIDRKNKHQSRSQVLPQWQEIIDCFRAKVGTPFQELKPIKRELITCPKALTRALGALASIAAHRFEPIRSSRELLDLLRRVLLLNRIPDEKIHDLYKKKAQRIDNYLKERIVNPEIDEMGEAC